MAQPTFNPIGIFDAHQVIERVVSELQEKIHEQGIRLFVNLEAELPLIDNSQSAFSRLLGELLQEFVDRTASAHPASERTIHLNSSLRDERFLISLHDNGRPVISTKGEGYARLTAILRSAHDLGARTELSHANNPGVKVTLELPLAGAMPSGQRLGENLITIHPQFQKAKILLLDDDRDVCEVLQYALTDLGLEVAFFAKPSDALKAISESHFDVVISDFQMPGMRGDEFISKARRLARSNTHYVLMTGDARFAVDRPRTSRSPPDDNQDGIVILQKPFDEDRLVAILRKWLPIIPQP